MSMSDPMQKSYDQMQEWGKKLTAYDFGNTCVRILHEEGTSFFLENAFIVEPDEDYIWVFTEHLSDLIFHKNELLGWHTLACVPNHSVNYVPRSMKGYPEKPRWAKEIIAVLACLLGATEQATTDCLYTK
jgi:hypothetical protein